MDSCQDLFDAAERCLSSSSDGTTSQTTECLTCASNAIFENAVLNNNNNNNGTASGNCLGTSQAVCTRFEASCQSACSSSSTNAEDNNDTNNTIDDMNCYSQVEMWMACAAVLDRTDEIGNPCPVRNCACPEKRDAFQSCINNNSNSDDVAELDFGDCRRCISDSIDTHVVNNSMSIFQDENHQDSCTVRAQEACRVPDQFCTTECGMSCMKEARDWIQACPGGRLGNCRPFECEDMSSSSTFSPSASPTASIMPTTASLVTALPTTLPSVSPTTVVATTASPTADDSFSTTLSSSTPSMAPSASMTSDATRLNPDNTLTLAPSLSDMDSGRGVIMDMGDAEVLESNHMTSVFSVLGGALFLLLAFLIFMVCLRRRRQRYLMFDIDDEDNYKRQFSNVSSVTDDDPSSTRGGGGASSSSWLGDGIYHQGEKCSIRHYHHQPHLETIDLMNDDDNDYNDSVIARLGAAPRSTGVVHPAFSQQQLLQGHNSSIMIPKVPMTHPTTTDSSSIASSSVYSDFDERNEPIEWGCRISSDNNETLGSTTVQRGNNTVPDNMHGGEQSIVGDGGALGSGSVHLRQTPIQYWQLETNDDDGGTVVSLSISSNVHTLDV